MRAAVLALCLMTASAWATKPGDRAHDFDLPTLDGKSVKLSDLRGSVVVVDFWASWCAPCKKELPALDKLAAKYPGKVVVLAVNVDKERKKAEGFLERAKVKSVRILLDPSGKVAAAYDVPTMPSSFIVDDKGMVKYVQSGYKSGDERTIETRIRELMK